jgi:signal transduction histidine kinase
MTQLAPASPRRRLRTRLVAAADSLAARVMLASGVLALLTAAVFAVLAFAVSDLSDAAGREAQAREVVADTVVLQKLVLDLEAGVRGFVITRQERVLEPLEEARDQLPAALATFRREAGDDPERRRIAREVSGLINAYIDEYVLPVLTIARTNPAAAGGETARQESRRRTDEIRDRLDEVLEGEQERATETAESAQAEARRAIMLGFGGIAASVAMILLLGFYLTRSIARPVRQVAAEADRIARGELNVQLDERGPGEVGALKRAFRAMAADLAERQRALEDQNERLRESERLKSELISIVSHEIRTPLASILGFASVLQQKDVDAVDRARFLEIIGSESRRLATLLDDFLDVQLLEEGPLELSLGEVDISALVRTQALLFSAESERHRLDVRLPEEPLVVRGDVGRLAQVLANLISNAIKYSPQGGTVEVAAEQDDEIVRILVRDEGFGIPPELGDRIFTKFFRGGAAARGIPGSGLGLALARSVVQAHGGSIGFESAVGQGTTFSVELPKHPRDASAVEAGERRHGDV